MYNIYTILEHTLSFMIRINLHRLVRFSLFVDAIIPKKLIIFGLFVYRFLIQISLYCLKYGQFNI